MKQSDADAAWMELHNSAERSDGPKDARQYAGFRELARREYPGLSEEAACDRALATSRAAMALAELRENASKPHAPHPDTVAMDAEVARQKATVAAMRKRKRLL